VTRLSATTREARALAARLEPHVVSFAEAMTRQPLAIERTIRPELE
jgi:hypothetical protein